MPYQKRSLRTIWSKDLKKHKADRRIRVYVECFPEKSQARKNDIYVDHHCEFIRRRSALIQVKKLFKLEITQRDLWLEAFDRTGVWGALHAGAPRKTVNQWIEHELTRDCARRGRKYWLDLIRKSPVVQGVKIIRLFLNQEIDFPRTTSLIHLFDFISYPQRKNILVIIGCRKKF